MSNVYGNPKQLCRTRKSHVGTWTRGAPVPTRAFENELHYWLRVRIASGPVPDLLKEGHHVIE